MCPVCCALVRSVRACPFQLPFKCVSVRVCVCLSDGQSKHPWVGVYVPVCLAAQHCSGWRDSRALSHTADFTRSHSLSCLRLQPSLCRSPVTHHPSPPPSLVSSHALFRSHVCLPLSSLLSFTDTWAHWFAVWMGQRSLSGYPAVWPWSVQARRRLECERGSMERGSKTQMMSESLSGKMGAKMDTDWPEQRYRALSRTDQLPYRDETLLSHTSICKEHYCMYYCSSHLSLLVNVTAVKVKLSPALHLHDCCSPLKCKTTFQIEAYQSVTVSECWCNMTWLAHLIYDDFTQMHFIIRDTGKLSKMSYWPTTTNHEYWYDIFELYWAEWWQNAERRC